MNLTSLFFLSWYQIDLQTLLYVPDNVGYISRRTTFLVRSSHWKFPTGCRLKLVEEIGICLEESNEELLELFKTQQIKSSREVISIRRIGIFARDGARVWIEWTQNSTLLI